MGFRGRAGGPRRFTTIFIPIFARMRNPSFEGCPPRYRVVVASPKLGRCLRIDLLRLDCWAGEEDVSPGYTCAADSVTASRARIAKLPAGRGLPLRTSEISRPTIRIEIGRASRWGRGEVSVGALSFKKKKNKV